MEVIFYNFGIKISVKIEGKTFMGIFCTFGGKIWRILAKKFWRENFGGKVLAGKFWRENLGGKSLAVLLGAVF